MSHSSLFFLLFFFPQFSVTFFSLFHICQTSFSVSVFAVLTIRFRLHSCIKLLMYIYFFPRMILTLCSLVYIHLRVSSILFPSCVFHDFILCFFRIFCSVILSVFPSSMHVHLSPSGICISSLPLWLVTVSLGALDAVNLLQYETCICKSRLV